MSSPNAYVPNPKPETLAEFALYSEVIDAAGEALMSLDDALMRQADREAARSRLSLSAQDYARRFPLKPNGGGR